MTGQIGKDANFKSDYHTDDYNFEAYKPKNSRDEGLVYCKNDSGVEIDGFLFFPESVEADESYARREYTRTKIMSGGEFVTRGQYVPKAFNFKTSLDIDPAMPTMYDKVFEVMENKPCEVLSPYMGDLFLAEVTIQKTHPKASPHTLELEIKVKEIANPKTRTIGDAVIEYPSTTSVSEKAISVKDVSTYTPKTPEESEREQITYDLKFKDKNGKVYQNPYKEGQ